MNLSKICVIFMILNANFVYLATVLFKATGCSCGRSKTNDTGFKGWQWIINVNTHMKGCYWQSIETNNTFYSFSNTVSSISLKSRNSETVMPSPTEILCIVRSVGFLEFPLEMLSSVDWRIHESVASLFSVIFLSLQI